ncbi:hypothetical protein D3C87_1108760 [compost metagenome]
MHACSDVLMRWHRIIYPQTQSFDNLATGHGFVFQISSTGDVTFQCYRAQMRCYDRTIGHRFTRLLNGLHSLVVRLCVLGQRHDDPFRTHGLTAQFLVDLMLQVIHFWSEGHNNLLNNAINPFRQEADVGVRVVQLGVRNVTADGPLPFRHLIGRTDLDATWVTDVVEWTQRIHHQTFRYIEVRINLNVLYRDRCIVDMVDDVGGITFVRCTGCSTWLWCQTLYRLLLLDI